MSLFGYSALLKASFVTGQPEGAGQVRSVLFEGTRGWQGVVRSCRPLVRPLKYGKVFPRDDRDSYHQRCPAARLQMHYTSSKGIQRRRALNLPGGRQWAAEQVRACARPRRSLNAC